MLADPSMSLRYCGNVRTDKPPWAAHGHGGDFKTEIPSNTPPGQHGGEHETDITPHTDMDMGCKESDGSPTSDATSAPPPCHHAQHKDTSAWHKDTSLRLD